MDKFIQPSLSVSLSPSLPPSPSLCPSLSLSLPLTLSPQTSCPVALSLWALCLAFGLVAVSPGPL